MSISNGLRWFKNTSFELISMWFHLVPTAFNYQLMWKIWRNDQLKPHDFEMIWFQLLSTDDFSIFSTCSRTSAPDASRRLQVYWAAAGSKSASGPRSYVWSRCTRCACRSCLRGSLGISQRFIVPSGKLT